MKQGKLLTAVFAIVASSLALQAPRAAAAIYEPSTSFCAEPVVRDFLAPLAQMPKLHAPGTTGRVGFGPHSLVIRSRPALIDEEKKVGYTLALRHSKPVAHLDWDVVTTLSLVDRRGRPFELIRQVKRHVNSVTRGKGAGVHFRVGPEPGFYRLTSIFRDSSGRKLGGYGFYFRSVAPTERAPLVLLADSIRPGQEVGARIENLGTTLVRYGVPYVIERFDGAAWALAPESPRGPWIAIGFQAFPGRAGKCSIFPAPTSMPPGRYRMTKSVSVYRGDLSPREIRDHLVSAEFDVLR